MTARRLHGRVLNPGAAAGEALVLDEPLSFWGGFDPATGRIIDRSHPQADVTIGGKVLIMPASRGSAGTPAGLAEALRTGVGPCAVLLGRVDVNIAVGAQVADALYRRTTPVIVTGDGHGIRSGDRVTVEENGTVRVET